MNDIDGGAMTAKQAQRMGVLAAVAMLGAQLAWRLLGVGDRAVPAFPELIAAGISRLVPLSVFGTMTERFGGAAKQGLFAAVVVGVIAVGYFAGGAAWRLTRLTGRDLRGRLIAGLLISAALLLVTLVVVLPVAHLGFFAATSSYAGEIRLQLVVTFAVFGLVWGLGTTPKLSVEAPDSSQNTTNRRFVLGRAAWMIGAAALVIGGGTFGRRWLHNRAMRGAGAPSRALTVDDQLAKSIVATQRARQGYISPEATPSPISAVSTQDVATLQSDIATAMADPFALFNQLETEGALTPVLTPVREFYHVSKNFVDPTVSAVGWNLTVTGLVDRGLTLSYDDVVSRSTTKKITTLSCISNELNGNLIGTAEWQGFPLRDLLLEAGIKPNAVDVRLHCADDYEESFPVTAAMDPDTLIVIGMNGEPLGDDHGFPARIIVPGIYGMKNVKWLESIEVIDFDFKGYWETLGWSDSAIPQIWGRIDYPRNNQNIDAGLLVAAGIAAAGDRGVSRVEVTINGGQTWKDAVLEPSLNPPFTWVRWAYHVNVAKGKFTLQMRVTDGNGTVAVEREQSPLPDGATGWPKRTFRVER